MATSRYEKYVIRKPGVIMRGGRLEIPEKIDVAGRPDTGPLVWCASKLVPGSSVGLESGIISGDIAVGTGAPGTFAPHKHNFDEMFLFMGTNPADISELGAEIEFWLGEKESLEKVTLNTSGCVYVPAGLGHFPLIWRNVRKPCVFVVVSCHPFDPASQRQEPVSLEGRPRPK